MSKIRRRPQSAEPRPTLRYGDRLGDFVINGFAGKGATSYVYRARHETSFEPVAVKVLHPHLVDDEVKRRRFLREADMMMQFNHPNVVYFHEIFEIGEQLAFVMEFIEGDTLDEWLERHGEDLDEVTVTCLFLDILRGLHHAHRRGVYHRDLKPANILITQAESRWVAKIIDFGVARFAHEPLPDEDRAKIVGTAAYISPEEVRDPETVCESSDLYSIGVMLYEAVCGQRPFQGMPVRDLMKAHVEISPERPRKMNPGISSDFESILLKTLTKTPDERFDSAPALIAALEEAARRAERRAAMPKRVDPETRIATTEWSREENSEAVWLMFRQLMLVAMTFLLSTGASADGAGAHHLDRSNDLPLPLI
jgi:serine/threonine-protein kinase